MASVAADPRPTQSSYPGERPSPTPSIVQPDDDDVVPPVRNRRTGPPATADADQLCQTLGIEPLEVLAEQCRRPRRALGMPTACPPARGPLRRWSRCCIARSTTTAGPSPAPSALLAVAADRDTPHLSQTPGPGSVVSTAEQLRASTAVTRPPPGGFPAAVRSRPARRAGAVALRLPSSRGTGGASVGAPPRLTSLRGGRHRPTRRRWRRPRSRSTAHVGFRSDGVLHSTHQRARLDRAGQGQRASNGRAGAPLDGALDDNCHLRSLMEDVGSGATGDAGAT